MELVLFLTGVSVLFKLSEGVKCYKCEPYPRTTNTSRPCDEFLNGDRQLYVVDCPDSTMCEKRVTSDAAISGETITERRCAQQTFEGNQIKVDKKWVLYNKIYEVYNETCKESQDAYRRTKTELCFCRGDLCNHGTKLVNRYWLVMAFLASFLLLV